MKPDRAVASFDSATAMLRVLARHLHGRSSPALGLGPRVARFADAVLPAVNRLPASGRELVYTMSGQAEAVPPKTLADIDAEAVARWVTSHYPLREYPVVMLGSSSGALTHLAALAGIPWLPQTLLVPVRQRGIDRDRPREAMRALAGARQDFAGSNPQISLHHMHDANQDRLMIQGMAYFRYKYQRLPAAYLSFLRRCLPAGGTVLVTDCAETWPTTNAGPQQVFQHGAVGGLTADDYIKGSPRVARFLAEQNSSLRGWDGPAPDATSPEAEWGFDPALLPDLSRLCADNGWKLERLRFDHPDTLSAPVADTYRAWYRENDYPGTRLLVDCFALLEVHLPLTLGLVPYWTTFGTQPALETLLGYLDSTEPYDEIDLGLFSHGTCSAGYASIDEWDHVLGRARRDGRYCGIDRKRFPQDFASNVRFHEALSSRPGSPAEPGPAPWSWVRNRLRSSSTVDYYLNGAEPGRL